MVGPAGIDSSGTRARTPLDLAFGRCELSSLFEGRVVLDPTGRRVAYQVRTPPESSAEGGARFLSSGVPRSVIGERVHLATLDSGEAVAVGPDGTNSWHPSWAPDAGAVAFYCDACGFPQLWVYDVAAGTSRPVSDVQIKAKLWIGDEPQWLPDGRGVVVPLAPEGGRADENVAPQTGGPSVRVHRGRNQEDETGAGEASELNEHFMLENIVTIAAINISSGAVRVLVPADTASPPSVAQVSPSGRWVSYLSVFLQDEGADAPTSESFHDLVVVPATGGEPQAIARHATKSAFPPGYYLDTYIWHPERDQLTWIDHGQLWTVDLDDAPGTPSRLAPDLEPVTVSPLLLTGNKDAVIVGTNPTGRAHGDSNDKAGALALVPLDGAPPSVFRLPEDVTFQRVVPQSFSTAWEPRAGTVTVLVRLPATTELALLRIDTGTGEITRLWHDLAKLEPVGAPADHRFLLAAYQDYRHPADLHVLDTDGQPIRRLTAVEPRLDDVRLGPVETFQTRVPQHDGTFADATTAVLLPADTSPGKELPAIMFCYPGGRVSQFAAEFGGGMPSTLPLVPFLERGYAVLLAEAPIGPDGEPGNPLEEIAAVLVPQLYHAAGLGYVDLERVALAGQSYGG